MRSPETNGVAVTIDDLTIDFPARRPSPAHRAIDGVSFSVAENEIIGLIGESGSGKSTLARILAGELGATKSGDPAPVISGGDAHVLGYGLRGIRKKALTRLTFDVAYLPQDAASRLMPELTVAETIAEPILARDKRYNRTAIGVRVATMLDAVQLPLALLEKYPFELSSGQRQRVAIARSLVLGPRLFIADEPTAGIDVTVRGAVDHLMGAMREREGFAAIVVSHDLRLLRQLTKRVVALHRGSMVGLAPIDVLLKSGEHPFLVGLADASHEAEESAERR